MEDVMRRIRRTLVGLALGLALAATTTAAAAAMPPTAAQDRHDQLVQRKALYQSELEHNLAARAAVAVAAYPAARTAPAVPSPGVVVPVTLLIGLVGAWLAVPPPSPPGPPRPAGGTTGRLPAPEPAPG
jgi:hypothetical protein